MKMTKLTDPYILNAKIELEGIRECLKFRNKLQYSYKRMFTEAQSNGGQGAGNLAAMIEWNKTYINKLLKSVTEIKARLDYLYESERRIHYLVKRREDTDK